MSYRLVNEDPFQYQDEETGKLLPVRKILDIESGEYIFVIIHDDNHAELDKTGEIKPAYRMTPVHIPKKIMENQAPMKAILGAPSNEDITVFMKYIKEQAELDMLKALSIMVSGMDVKDVTKPLDKQEVKVIERQ